MIETESIKTSFIKEILLAWVCLSISSFALAQPLNEGLRRLRSWQVDGEVSDAAVKHYGIERCFVAESIPDKVFKRMQGKSYPKGCTIPREQLRYVKLLYVDFGGKTRIGELVCDKAIASDVVKVFHELYTEHYPIQSVRLIDDFGASDESSMRANNTSCFCYRVVKGSRKLSPHARGRAIDINPLYNPCVRRLHGRTTVQPSTAAHYADRSASYPHKITRSDTAYRIFTKYGFRWGGAWRTVKDYQHFEK